MDTSMPTATNAPSAPDAPAAPAAPTEAMAGLAVTTTSPDDQVVGKAASDDEMVSVSRC
jgi:hypothetical protein